MEKLNFIFPVKQIGWQTRLSVHDRTIKCRNSRLAIYFNAHLSLAGLTISAVAPTGRQPIRGVRSQQGITSNKERQAWSATDGTKLVANVATRKHKRPWRKFCPHDHFRKCSRCFESAIFLVANM